MAYFAALMARGSNGAWDGRDVDLDGVEDVKEITALMRAAGDDDGPVLLLVEQEDTWFGVVRVDGEDDPRIFLSDPSAAVTTALGELLLAANSIEPTEYDSSAPSREDSDSDDQDEPSGSAGEPAGELDLLADLGVEEDLLLDLVDEDGLLPTEALERIATEIGCAEEFESLR